MKIITNKLFSQKKTIYIFLYAIFLPLLIICYLSLNTFSKRREAVKKLLESNLWISGEAGLKSIEGAILEYERKVLIPENFINLIQSKQIDRDQFPFTNLSKEIPGQFFLLDADYKIVFPETGSENILAIQWEKELQNSQFAQFFKRAEYFEFSQKDFNRAADLYKEGSLSADSKQLRALALEGGWDAALYLQKNMMKRREFILNYLKTTDNSRTRQDTLMA